MKRPQTSSKHLFRVLLVLGAAVVLAWWIIIHHLHQGKTRIENSVVNVPRSKQTAVNPVRSCMGALNSSGNQSTNMSTLMELRKVLTSMPASEAIGLIRAYLGSGVDKDTGLTFSIGSGGALTGWPTLRTFLLDELLNLDPSAASSISRGILFSPSTADEWAIALRNVARAETGIECSAFVSAKTMELISNPAWQANPSFGYLNAFDVLVHTQATESAPLLSELIQRKDRKDLAHAGFLTLDRLVQRQPADMLERLSSDKVLQQSRPEMTSQQFARADLRDEIQRKIVGRWLLDPARTAVELNSFTGSYPNCNRFVSNNLLTNELPVSGVDLAAHDREVLEILNGWAADPAFESVKTHIRVMIARIESFSKSSTPDPSASSSSKP